jgi:hypothetical protein
MTGKKSAALLKSSVLRPFRVVFVLIPVSIRADSEGQKLEHGYSRATSFWGTAKHNAKSPNRPNQVTFKDFNKAIFSINLIFGM